MIFLRFYKNDLAYTMFKNVLAFKCQSKSTCSFFTKKKIFDCWQASFFWAFGF